MGLIISLVVCFLISLIEVLTGHTSEALYFLLMSIGVIEVMRFMTVVDIRNRLSNRDKATSDLIKSICQEIEKRQKESSTNG